LGQRSDCGNLIWNAGNRAPHRRPALPCHDQNQPRRIGAGPCLRADRTLNESCELPSGTCSNESQDIETARAPRMEQKGRANSLAEHKFSLYPLVPNETRCIFVTASANLL